MVVFATPLLAVAASPLLRLSSPPRRSSLPTSLAQYASLVSHSMTPDPGDLFTIAANAIHSSLIPQFL